MRWYKDGSRLRLKQEVGSNKLFLIPKQVAYEPIGLKFKPQMSEIVGNEGKNLCSCRKSRRMTTIFARNQHKKDYSALFLELSWKYDL